MATYYVGPRPILRGVNTNDMVNPYTTMTGKAKGKGTYPLYNTSHLLGGFPDNAHTPGTGYFPGDVFMSQVFRGLNLYIFPLANPTENGYGFGRFNPDLYKGLSSTLAFTSGFGHAERENDYKLRQYTFKGVASAQAFANTGHAARTDAQGAPSTYGYFRPEEEHGVTSSKVFTSGYGQSNATGSYGRNKVQEWKGVTSAKAL